MSAARKTVGRDRNCCDGLCQQGRYCPSFAPGVIEVHRRPGLARRALRALGTFLDWLGGLFL